MGKTASGAMWLNKYDFSTRYYSASPVISYLSRLFFYCITYNAIFRCRDLLSEFDYWQFWRNTADSDVVRYVHITVHT